MNRDALGSFKFTRVCGLNNFEVVRLISMISFKVIAIILFLFELVSGFPVREKKYSLFDNASFEISIRN